MERLVLIPIFNEEGFIEPVIREIRRHYRDDILVVNDGSTDRSAEIMGKIKGITVLSHERNMGYGQSLITGFDHAVKKGYQRLVTIDCDEQHEPYHIPEIFNGLEEEGVDIYSASRYLKEMENSDAPPEDRYRINRIITREINMITGYGLTDGFCGLKGYRVGPLGKMDLKEKGYAFPIEFWIQAYRLGLSAKEFPIERVYKNLGRTFGSGLDNPDERLNYYQQVLKEEAERWQISLPLELTRTI